MAGNNTVIDVLRALDGEIEEVTQEEIVSLLEDGYRIVNCPICGNKTMDCYAICCHCGWEYDIFIDYDDDNEFSDCNGTSLGEYKNVYRILWDAYEKRKNGKLGKFYVITCYPSEFSWSIVSDSQATYGAFDSIEACHKALNENRYDMHKRTYDLAVVDCIDTESNINEIGCFLWSEEKQGFFETDKKADWSSGWVKLV